MFQVCSWTMTDAGSSRTIVVLSSTLHFTVWAPSVMPVVSSE